MEYQKLYTYLFNQMTDAIQEIEKCNYGVAKEILMKAQQDAEELYMEIEE